MKKLKLTGLGKGLSALIPQTELTKDDVATLKSDDGKVSGSIALIDLSKVMANPWQPREEFEPEALKELADSIKERGIIQAITVRRLGDGTYQLIAGERRVRASKLVGKSEIPAYILEGVSDAHMLEMAIVENIQRENLNAVEVALGYQRLIDEVGLTQEEVGIKVGKDRSTVTNFLRLLKLPSEVQSALRQKRLTMGHARAIAGLSQANQQLMALDYVLEHELSVRKSEILVKEIESGRHGKHRPASTIPSKKKLDEKKPLSTQALLNEAESNLRKIFATNVRIKMKSSDSGSIEIDFYNIEDLGRFLEMFSQLDNA